MKPKKAKKHRPNVHFEFPVSDEACKVLSNSLIFLLNLKDFSFEEEKISLDSANEAEQKWFNRDRIMTRGEVRATAIAIEVVLARLPGQTNEYLYMEEDFPDLLTDLERKLPTLQLLQPTFQKAVQDLKKIK